MLIITVIIWIFTLFVRNCEDLDIPRSNPVDIKQSEINLMKSTNPSVIPRNHIVEKILKSAENEDLLPLKNLIEAFKNPYNHQLQDSEYQSSPPPGSENYRTFCGT